MIQLAKKLSYFALAVLALVVPFAWIEMRASNFMMKSDAFKLAKGVDGLIVGDSHAESSLDPAMIPGTINIARANELLFYTYYKMRYFLEMNPGAIHKVILAFSYHNIGKNAGYYFIEPPYSNMHLESYYLYLDKTGKEKVSSCRNYRLYSIKREYGFPLMAYRDQHVFDYICNGSVDKSHIPGYGGFKSLVGSNLDLWRAQASVSRYLSDNNETYAGYVEVMINALDRIASLCAEKNIKLYLYNSPLHVIYRRLIPIADRERYENAVKTIKGGYGNVVPVDMSCYPLEDALFYNGNHVNHLGAVIVSRAVARLVRTGLSRSRAGGT